MEHESVESGFVPDATPATSPAKSPRRLVRVLRWPAALTAAGVVAAITLTAAPTSQAASPRPVTHVATTFGKGLVPTAGGESVTAHHAAAIHPYVTSTAADGETTGGGSHAGGGIHGAFSMYDGAGGGIEFWFDPTTGQLTLAIGAGVGAGGEGVLGTYAPGSAPEPGLYTYVDADFAVGTVSSVNVAGEYSLVDGKFVGTIGGSVGGRHLSISSDGSSVFDVSTTAEEGAEGFTGAIGIKGVYKFDIGDVITKIWNSIWDGVEGVLDLFDMGFSDTPAGNDDSVDGATADDGGATADDDGGDGTYSDDDGTTADDDGTYSDDDSDGSYSDDDGGYGDDDGGSGGYGDDDGGSSPGPFAVRGDAGHDRPATAPSVSGAPTASATPSASPSGE